MKMTEQQCVALNQGIMQARVVMVQAKSRRERWRLTCEENEQAASQFSHAVQKYEEAKGVYEGLTSLLADLTKGGEQR